MENEEFNQFVWGLVDGTLEHVFFRFPEDGITRAYTYRKVAAALLEIATDLERD